MSKSGGVTLRMEVWMVGNNGRVRPVSNLHGNRVPVPKVAFRDTLGRFNGATNYRGTFRP